MGFLSALGKIGQIGASFIPGAGPAISAGIGLAGDIAGGVMGAKASKAAAKKQLEAANNAIGTLNQYGQQSRDTLSGVLGNRRADASNVYDQQRGFLDPYASQGAAALGALQNNAYDEWQGPAFQAPNLTEDPGYQFRLGEGQKALERSQSARGILGGGAAAKALTRYAQDFASNEYNNAYNRSASEYDRNYGQFMDRSNQRWNRLSQLTGYGMNAASQQAGFAGNYGTRLYGAEGDYGSGVADVNNLQSGRLSDIMLGAGNANAAGTVGAYNAYGNAINGAAETLGGMFGKQQPPVNYAARPIGGNFQASLRRNQFRTQPGGSQYGN